MPMLGFLIYLTPIAAILIAATTLEWAFVKFSNFMAARDPSNRVTSHYDKRRVSR